MQAELHNERPDLDISILNVNGEGLESGLESLFEDTTLPVVQDDATAQVWVNWEATWRDVYVLDGDNEVYAVFNLTSYGLDDSANYEALKALFVEAAGG